MHMHIANASTARISDRSRRQRCARACGRRAAYSSRCRRRRTWGGCKDLFAVECLSQGAGATRKVQHCLYFQQLQMPHPCFTATHCNTLYHTCECNTCLRCRLLLAVECISREAGATHILQHVQCKTLQLSAAHYNTLQDTHTAAHIHCNWLQQECIAVEVISQGAGVMHALQRTLCNTNSATHITTLYSTLQYTATRTHCNTHTAIHCNKLISQGASR